jgi:DNA-binding MarR family transcriptional regulator
MCQHIDGRYIILRFLRVSFFGYAGKLRSGNFASVISQLQPEDYEALASFRYAIRKFLSFSRRALAEEAQLTPEQYEALLALKAFSGETGLSVSDLSERLQVKPHTAVSLVDKLEEFQFVRRAQGTADRRQVFVTLTAAGSRVLAKVAVLHRREIRIRSPEMIDALLRLRK